MVRGVPLRAALLGAGAAFVLALGPASAQDMNKEIEALKKRVAELESGTSVSISGFVKGDFYIDSDIDLGKSFGNAAGIQLDGAASDDDDGAVGAHANQSRLRFGTSTDTDYGTLSTVVEGDMWPGNLRLRFAYGQLGPVLAGQAWSIRGDDHTGADTVDFDGPAGVVATRTPQLRLTLPLGEGFYGQAAIEPAISGNEVPTVLAAIRYSADWGAVNLTGAVGRYDEGGQNVSTHAFHVGAHINATAATKVMATLNMTRGDAQIYGGAGATGMDASGNLKAYDSMGGMAGVSHGWSDSIRSGVYYGWVENDNSAAALNEMVQTVHANIIWSPVPAADIGAEVIYGRRETNGGAEGEATRFQIGVKYSF
ncbi:MAG: hypothetical protein OXP07_02670 [Defluviicoccus sp.]|nr:hypothetical protein [Defluviicoccus sp.]